MARKTLADQVAEQAVTINDLRAEVEAQRYELRLRQDSIDRLEQDSGSLKDALSEQAKWFHDSQAKLSVTMEELEKVKKELDSAKSSCNYYSSLKDKAEADIEQAHAALDVIPEALPREFEQEYGKGKRALAARFIGTMLAVVRASK